MEFELDPDDLVRSASGLLYAILGVFLLIFPPRSATRSALGYLCLGFGSWLTLENIVPLDRDGTRFFLFPLALVAFPLQIAGTLRLVLQGSAAHRQALRPWLAGTGVAWAVWAGFVLADAGSVAAAFTISPASRALVVVILVLFFAGLASLGLLGVAAALRARAEPGPRPQGVLASALLAIGFQLFLAYYFGVVTAVVVPSLWFFGVAVGLMLVQACAWLGAIRGSQRGIAWLALACVLITFVGSLVGTRQWMGEIDNDSDPFGLLGVSRLIGIVLLAFAIFRFDLLRVPLSLPTIRVGTFASLGLAALFITAQVTQNLLSDELGLLWGGVVAGVVVFAAAPVQRGMERRAQPTPAVDGEAAFRKAARLALRDKALSHDEEIDLIELAHQVGVAPRRAAGILDEERATRGHLGGTRS